MNYIAKFLNETAGAAKFVAACKISKFTTSSSEAIPAATLRKT